MIEYTDESGYEPELDGEEISNLAAFVCQKMRVHPGADLSIILVDEATMTDLHIQWMDEPGPTDVLSFPMDEIRPPAPGEEPVAGMLGDVVVCPSYAALNAKRAGHALIEEVLLLVTHGILHVLGYDHGTPEEEKEMFSLQSKLLLEFLAQRA